MKRLNEIDQLRYQKILELIQGIGCDPQEFCDTRNYVALKAHIDDMAGFFSGKGEYGRYKCVRKRYQGMYNILSNRDNKALLSRRYSVDPDWMVRMLYKLSDCECYGMIFVFMLLKDFIIVHAPFLRKYWNKRERKGSIL